MSAEATLLDVLTGAVQEAPHQLLVQVESDGSEQVRTYRQLLDDALLVAGGFRSAGLPAGAPVMLLAGRSDDFLPCFWGALAAGLVPVPLAPAPDKVLAVWDHLRRPPLVVPEALESLVRGALSGVSGPSDLRLLTVEQLRTGSPITSVHTPALDDLAFLQYSSGSTGTPRGVELTHANLLANLAQTRAAGAARAGDVMVSWLPYFHDMGLIGAHLAPLSVRIKQVKLEPADFGRRPALWYEVAARHRATLLPMASFGMAVTLKRVTKAEVAALDLGTVRLFGVGAEPISVGTWRRFVDHLRPAGLHPGAVTPMYGLAEATLAVTFPPLGEVARPLALDRSALAAGRAVDVVGWSDDAADGMSAARSTDLGPAEFLDVGCAVPGGELRIVGDDGGVLGDSEVGQVEFRGPNVARGYHANPAETAQAFVDGWLRTGDVGFLRGDRLCITGRAKDVLFVHGQKYQAHDLEQVVTSTPGVPSGRVAVVGSTDRATGAERIAVFVSLPETPSGTPARALVALLAAVRARVREALAYDDVCVLPIAPKLFPRTTSGKLRRGPLREAFAAGNFAALEAEVDGWLSPPAGEPNEQHQSLHQVEAHVAGIWSDVLGLPVDRIDRHDRFLAIGGSSVTAMQVLAKLEDAFGGPLEPAVLRDCATVAALAAHLAGRSDRPVTPAVSSSRQPLEDPAAVVGLACRFPDADTPDAFWDNLASGRDSVTGIPSSRWVPAPDAKARWGAFLEDVAGFDADYFGVDPDEAAVMDPHARIFLEVAHEALERAGYAGRRRQGRRIGVFVAVGESGYPQLLQRVLEAGVPLPPTALVGNLRHLIAARVAHHLDLTGPVMAVDTACSSALAALHLARGSLAVGECDVAVVGAVSLNLTSTGYQLLEAAQALSPTGRCRTFSTGADGFVPGEGAGAVVLESLSAAQEAGDRVLAVVRGSALNNDGRSMSLMAPNPLRQEAVIADAYRSAGIDPATISYVEAHGTGTAVGDPIEARSLLRTFPPSTAADPRWLGSVKTNVGHLLNAAGLPSLLKVVLSLQHRQLPGSLHYARPSAEFDLAAAGLEVVTGLRDWTSAGPRRAGINGFGFGGTNVHVILEEAPAQELSRSAAPATEAATATAADHATTVRESGPCLLTLSAASEPALRALAQDLATHLRQHPGAVVGDVVFSASTARDDRGYRLALVTHGDLGEELESAVARPAPVGGQSRRRPRLAVTFPGQGSQLIAMGASLHETHPAYRESMEHLASAVGLVRGRSLVEWSLDPGADPKDLVRTDVAQPLLVAFEISLFSALNAWGVRPDAVLGHSVGELAAAAASGALDPADAVRFAALRGAAMQEKCMPGSMAAVVGPEPEVRSVLAAYSGQLSLAAVNGPTHFVLAGSDEVLDDAVSVLTGRGCRARRLPVSHAFHSQMMTPAIGPLRTAAGQMGPGTAQIPLLSTVTGEWAPSFDATYAEDHALRPVMFGGAVQRLLDEGYDTFLEVGPGTALTALTRTLIRSTGEGARDLEVLACQPGRRQASGAALLDTVGRLWVRGVSISRPTDSSHRVDVPTYPFQRRRHWLPDLAQPPTTPEAPPVSSLLHRFAWNETPLPAGAVLRSVYLMGENSRAARRLTDRLVSRGVTVERSSARADSDPSASVMVVFPPDSAELQDLAALDRVARDSTTIMLDVARRLRAWPVPLIVVTEDVAVTGEATESPRPGQAVLAGLAMALAEEGVRAGVRVVDLCSLDDESAWVEALVRELDAPPAAGPLQSVAWRGGRRLSKAPLLGGALQPGGPRLPSDGCYLITGGAGGVGTEVARFLAGRGRPQLILVGRSATCPPALLHELNQLGARPRYVAADISVERAVERLVDTLPSLDGVFHAAGSVGPGLLATLTGAEVAQVLAPKVRGTVLLARALDRRRARPRLFMAFSSIASVLPGYAGGLGPYAAANAFVDAFALAESSAGRPLQVLNFAAWTATGMTASAAFRAAAATRGVPELAVDQALRALHDATLVDLPQLLVLDAQGEQPELGSGLSKPPVEASPQAARDQQSRSTGSLRDLLRGLIAGELGLQVAEVDDDASFLAMGLDSLTAVDLVKQLERDLGRSLPTTLLFEYSSVNRLSDHLSPASSPGPAQDVAPATHPSSSFPLTPVQLAFHTTGRLHPDVPAYAALRQTVAGELDEDALAQSLVLLERRHPQLRMRIRLEDGEPRQLVEEPNEALWPRWLVARDLDRPVELIEDELCNSPFQLDCDSPVRAVLLRERGRTHLLLVAHHAAADGASLHVLAEELWQVYSALTHQQVPELPSLPSTFRDYVQTSQRLRTSEAFAVDLRYWRDRLGSLSSSPSNPALPYDGDPEAQPLGPWTAHQFAVSEHLTRALRAQAAELDVSLFHLVLAAYVRRLAAWGDTPTVTVNVARAGRDARLPEIARLVGPFADTLPLTVTVGRPGERRRDSDLGNLAQEVREEWLQSERHATVTTLDLARLLPAVDSAPRTAGTASFSFARFPVVDRSDGAVRVRGTGARTASAATRLGLVCWEFEGALQFSWNYSASLFQRATIERITGEFLAELDQGGHSAGRVDVDGRSPDQLSPVPSLAQRVRQQCRRRPAAVAVEAGEASLTYAQLERAADRLAERLRRGGVSTCDRVALLTEPGPDTVVGLVATLMAGATWVPLDAAHPNLRLTDHVSRAKVTAVVCSSSTRGIAEQLGSSGVFALDETQSDEIAAPDVRGDGDNVVNGEDIAYIIFTSGTSGRPKGVPITHSALTVYLDWAIETFGYTATDKMAATASICFDASVRQLLAPLLVGATIVAISPELRRDPAELLAVVEGSRVTVWSSVPTLWEQLLRAAERRAATLGRRPDLSALRWVHVGGEPLSPAHVGRWFELFGPGSRVVNLYGPTEATINATYDIVDAAPDPDVIRLPIGRAVAATVLEVVGRHGEACAPGEPGELFLAGPGLSPGYLDEPELTDQAFVRRGGRRFYRTGDRVVLRPDGRLDFLGRLDEQVKIRGHRVEPAEVELTLRGHPLVERVAVVAERSPIAMGSSTEEGSSALRLVAYVQLKQAPRSDQERQVAESLRGHVIRRLPDYEVPAQFRLVDELPLTPTGKVDRSSLALTAGTVLDAGVGRPGTAAQTETERALAAVWSSLLGVPEVFCEDDFFALGGDSIAVLEVFARLESLVPALPAPTAIYRHRTLSALAAAVDQAVDRAVDQAIERTADGVVNAGIARAGVPAAEAQQPRPLPGEPFPLTPAQRGFLLAEALAPQARSDLMACFRLTGQLEVELFRRAVDLLVDRHLMLRVVIAAGHRPPTQSELPPGARLKIAYDAIDPAQLSARIAAEREHRFDSSSWPLLRLQLLRLGSDDHALVVHGHHLIGDGYSVVLLGQDLMHLYDELALGEGPGLPPLRSTFRDYARLVLGPSTSTEAETQRDQPDPEHYAAPELRRPGSPADEPGDASARAGFVLGLEQTAALRLLAASEETTPYAPLLTAYYRALTRLTGQDDLLIGVVVTGRDYAWPDITRLVGPFARVVPVRARAPRSTFRAQLRHVSGAVTAAREDGSSMGLLAGRATATSSSPSSLGGQFLFSFLDFDSLGPVRGRVLNLTWDEAGSDLEPPPVGTDLLMTVRPVDGGLRVGLRASAGVLSPEELDEVAEGLRRDLCDAARRPSTVSTAAARRPSAHTPVLDAALVGYLPAPEALAAFAGSSTANGLREEIRARLFPEGSPRLLEVLATPWGRSGFVCLPTFASDLSSREALARETARAVELAATLGARAVSLAGMIPAYTGYGFDVVGALGPTETRVTTGHATTAASVVRTTLATLAATGSDLSRRTLAVVGVGSIGRSALELLLALEVGGPKRMVLCDLASRSRHLEELATDLRARGHTVEVALCGPDALAPGPVYAADLIVAAISADRRVLDVARLQPGTLVVDDSFPHCFEARAALDRMKERADVLVVGGGLLRCRPSTLQPADDPALASYSSHLLSRRIPDTIASCRLEPLLQLERPDLPVVHGLVDVTIALRYWEALTELGVEAAPLHLLHHTVPPDVVERFSERHATESRAG